jgi:hypothetical protein
MGLYDVVWAAGYGLGLVGCIGVSRVWVLLLGVAVSGCIVFPVGVERGVVKAKGRWV